MNFDPLTPIVIDAVTLRGIGSYLFGERLDIKPLTILCGENGSGKSTWLKALNVLKQSLACSRYPFGFAVEDWHPQDIQLTNACYHMADPGELGESEDLAHDEAYGVPGTIGLELRVIDDITLPSDPQVEKSHSTTAQAFLHEGICKKHTRFRLRVAHPTHFSDTTPTPQLRHVIELTINGRHTLRMEGERDPLQRFEAGFTKPRRSKPYTLYCSPSLFTESEELTDLVAIASIVDLNSMRIDMLTDDLDLKLTVTLIDLLTTRLSQLLRAALDGYFYIGAIREPFVSRDVGDAGIAPHSERRHVGAAGERAWLTENEFAQHRMRRLRDLSFEPSEMDAKLIAFVCVAKNNLHMEKISHIFDCMPPNIRSSIDSLVESLRNSSWPSAGSGDASVESLENQVRSAFTNGLNCLLEDRCLYSSAIWETEYRYFDQATGESIRETIVFDPDIRQLIEKGVSSLSKKEIRLLNYLLILDAFSEELKFVPCRQECAFEEYVSYWLKFLVDTKLHKDPPRFEDHGLDPYTFVSMGGSFQRLIHPTHFLRNIPAPAEKGHPSLVRLVNPYFGNRVLQPPRQMSAGFHQVFPIVVQLGMMRCGELIGVENPEVHLHPALQVKIAELLLEHAMSGRRIIVETHSDLVLRRVIRSMLEEKIAQSQVTIAFARNGRSKEVMVNGVMIPFSSSTLDPIRVDQQGRISNWPPGFLSDDVEESQRLLDVMYGRQSGANGDGDVDECEGEGMDDEG
jgi:energy-coupling factor transporter ATP-binding protein EcfA2